MRDHELDVNRDLWTLVNEQFTDGEATARWASETITWGLYGASEDDLRVLGDVSELEVVELGCGSAYLSAWLARRGAHPVGVDLSPAQLATARRCQAEFGVTFPLVEANAEDVPLPTSTFDLVLSEYGASVWCDPALWIPEAARLLKPGGRLVFLTNSVLVTLCVPGDEGHASPTLQRSQRSISRVQWPGGGIEFHPSHSDWIGLLRHSGFHVDTLHELYASPDNATPEYYDIATADWASKWPVEELWVATLDR